MKVKCQYCSKQYDVKDEYVGQKAKCKACGKTIELVPHFERTNKPPSIPTNPKSSFGRNVSWRKEYKIQIRRVLGGKAKQGRVRGSGTITFRSGNVPKVIIEGYAGWSHGKVALIAIPLAIILKLILMGGFSTLGDLCSLVGAWFPSFIIANAVSEKLGGRDSVSSNPAKRKAIYYENKKGVLELELNDGTWVCCGIVKSRDYDMSEVRQALESVYGTNLSCQ